MSSAVSPLSVRCSGSTPAASSASAPIAKLLLACNAITTHSLARAGNQQQQQQQQQQQRVLLPVLLLLSFVFVMLLLCIVARGWHPYHAMEGGHAIRVLGIDVGTAGDEEGRGKLPTLAHAAHVQWPCTTGTYLQPQPRARHSMLSKNAPQQDTPSTTFVGWVGQVV